MKKGNAATCPGWHEEAGRSLDQVGGAIPGLVHLLCSGGLSSRGSSSAASGIYPAARQRPSPSHRAARGRERHTGAPSQTERNLIRPAHVPPGPPQPA